MIRHADLGQRNREILCYNLHVVLNFFPGSIVSLRIIVIHPNHVRGKRTIVIDVRFAIRHEVGFHNQIERPVRFLFQNTDQQFVSADYNCRVVLLESYCLIT